VIADIATLPLRAGVRAAGRLVGAVETVVELAGHVVEALRPSPPRPASEPPRSRPVRSRAPFPAPAAEPAPEPEPIHVSEEPVVVAGVGGADVGAQVSVAEPWEGYRQMKASDVIDRLTAASPAELAVVQLYESQGRARKTVLAAVDQRLRYSQRK
jgi:hypothetical protein